MSSSRQALVWRLGCNLVAHGKGRHSRDKNNKSFLVVNQHTHAWEALYHDPSVTTHQIPDSQGCFVTSCLCSHYFITTDPGIRVLNALRVMPGLAAATEVLHRGLDQRDAVTEICHAPVAAAESVGLLQSLSAAESAGLVQSPGHKKMTMLTENISLAATIRKLVWPYTQFETPARICGREVPEVQPPQDQHSSSQPSHLMVALVNSVLALDHWLGGGGRNGSSTRTSLDLPSGSDSSKRDTSSSNGGGSSGARSSKTEKKGGNPKKLGFKTGTADVQGRRSSAVHRLQAMSLVNLVQLCLYRLHSENKDHQLLHAACPEWLSTILAFCQHLHNPSLQVIVAPPNQSVPLDLAIVTAGS